MRACSVASVYDSLRPYGPLCDPPGSSVHGIFQAGILEWVAMPSSRGFSQLRDQTRMSWVSCVAEGFFTPLSHQGSPKLLLTCAQIPLSKMKVPIYSTAIAFAFTRDQFPHISSKGTEACLVLLYMITVRIQTYIDMLWKRLRDLSL